MLNSSFFFTPPGSSQRGFEEAVSDSRDEATLSSPECMRKLECSKDTHAELFHLSNVSALNSTGHNKTSPRIVMETPPSRTITPDPVTQSTHSPGSVSASENYSALDSLDTDKVCDVVNLVTSSQSF